MESHFMGILWALQTICLSKGSCIRFGHQFYRENEAFNPVPQVFMEIDNLSAGNWMGMVNIIIFDDKMGNSTIKADQMQYVE